MATDYWLMRVNRASHAAWTTDTVRAALRNARLRARVALTEAPARALIAPERAELRERICGAGTTYVVHRDCGVGANPLAWRMTRLEGDEPVGHVGPCSFAGALQAAEDHGADLRFARDAWSVVRGA